VVAPHAPIIGLPIMHFVAHARNGFSLEQFLESVKQFSENALEQFLFRLAQQIALVLCFYAFFHAKPVPTFAENALVAG